MELRDYFRMIGKNLYLFLGIVVLVIAAALIYSKVQPTSYIASTTFTVNKVSSLDQKDVNYYLFDNYYNVQSAGLFSQIVATWFESPSLVKEVYEKAGVQVPEISQRKLSKTFRVDRQEPATINVSIIGTNEEEMGKLISGAAEVLQEKTDELAKDSKDAYYEIVRFQPIVTENKTDYVLNGLISLFAGALLGLLIIFSIEYFRKK